MPLRQPAYTYMITKTIAYKLEHGEPIFRFAYIISGPFKGYNVELLEKQKKAGRALPGMQESAKDLPKNSIGELQMQ